MLKLTISIFLTLYLTSCGQASSRNNNTQELKDAQLQKKDSIVSTLSDTTKPAKQKSVKYFPFELQELTDIIKLSQTLKVKSFIQSIITFFKNSAMKGMVTAGKDI